MTTRVLAHAHSTWSHDGHLPLCAYLDLAPRIDCSVVLLTEHEESGWTDERYDAYVRACDAISTTRVRLVPGLEFNQDGVHLLCYGLRCLPPRPSTPEALAADAHRQGCLLALAHPGKYHWRLPATLLAAIDSIDAIEIWNSKWIYDSAAGPHPSSIRMAAGKRIVIGQDVHKVKHLSPLVMVVEGDVSTSLMDGRYTVACRERHWSIDELRGVGVGAGLGSRMRIGARARAHRVWMDLALAGYRATRPLRGASSAAAAVVASGTTARSGWSLPRESAPVPMPVPMVSVVLPIRNEADFIGHALSSVLAQDYPADRLEILVADGGSTDGTRNIVHSLAARAPGRLRLIDNPGRIVPTGLNAALAVATGDVIVRVDGHCEIAPDFVRRAVAHLAQDDVECVGGVLETIGETRRARVIAAAMSAPFGVGGSAFRAGAAVSTLTDTVAFPAFTRAAIERTGRFDEELVRNQDDEYSYRLRRLGGRILLATDLHARYYSRGTLRALWRQSFQYGYWKVRVLQKHPRQMRLRQFIPAFFIAGLVSAAGLLAVQRATLPLFALIAGSYLVAACVASWRTAQRRGWDLLPWLPLTFGTLHVAYGAGSLVGLAAFWRRWREGRRDETHVPSTTLVEGSHARRPILPPRHS